MRKNKKNRIKRDGQPRWKKGDVAALNKEHNTSSRDRRARKNARISRFKTNCYTVRVNKTKKKARPLHQQATTSDERENAVNHSNHSVEGVRARCYGSFFFTGEEGPRQRILLIAATHQIGRGPQKRIRANAPGRAVPCHHGKESDIYKWRLCAVNYRDVFGPTQSFPMHSTTTPRTNR